MAQQSALTMIETYLREARPGELPPDWAGATSEQLGLDSLFAVELQMELEVRCDVALGGSPEANVALAQLTMAQLAQHIETLWAARPTPVAQ